MAITYLILLEYAIIQHKNSHFMLQNNKMTDFTNQTNVWNYLAKLK